MRNVSGRLALAGFGFFLASFSPSASFSPKALAMLDPTRQAAFLCAGEAAGSTLAQRLLFASAVATHAGEASAPMRLYDDLSQGHFPVSTESERARLYFNQGLLLNYGFNHAGAVRSFREAQRLDPDCALCWWGEAVALGPNINAPMDERDRDAALAALDRAQALKNRASPLERGLIEAVARRYSRDPKADRTALDGAYADAMIEVARRFPDDDIALLAAEAIMDTSPWNYWEADKRTAIGRSGEAVRLVEKVLVRNPDHPQASHLYIHLMENNADPRRAEIAADRLARPVASSAGHLVHMPSHIYGRLGRYSDAIKVNIAAARADEAYIRDTDDHSLVRYGYYPHNVHFIVTSAQMAGDMGTAIAEVRRLRTILNPETSARIAWIQAIEAAPYFAIAQFGSPKAILKMPPADARLPYAVAIRHYARAVAQAQRRNRKGVEQELGALAGIRGSNAFAEMIAQGVPATDLLFLAENVARGRLAFAEKRYDDAARLYRQAIMFEDKIPYMEPPYWYYPVNQSLGAALFKARRYDEASQAFRAALVQTPLNGWALYGLAQAEQARGKSLEAAAARQAFQRTWAGNYKWLRMERL